MEIVVTGSSGFIGKSVCDKLIYLGNGITEIDFTNGDDITDIKTFNKIINCDLIIHLAAKSYVPDAFKNPHSFYYINVLGTLNALETAKRTGAKLIFISSYIYGQPNYLPIDEKHKREAHNPYAQSKIMGEDLCFAYNRDFNIPIIIFRPFNIYGFGQAGNFIIPTIIEQIKAGKLKLMDSKPKRDFIHSSDVVNAIVKASEKNNYSLETLNLGTGISTSIEDLVSIFKENTKKDFEVKFENISRQSEVDDCYADISKTKEFLNWEARVSLKDGIKELIKLHNL
ncbi:MAG: NAD(P)-dependent oxidoreductase [Bacteroidales bacterium]|nr:NAD(P)-dependent oxidoreductase [Bacteroidales bacterium]